MKKKIYPVLLIAGVYFLFSLLWYAAETYHNPKEETFSVEGAGYLFTKADISAPVTVPVEIQAKKLKYVFHNQDDVIQGTLSVNGYSVYREEEFTACFVNGRNTSLSVEGGEPEESISKQCFTNRKGEYFIFSLPGGGKLGYGEAQNPVLLVISTKKDDSALDILKYAAKEAKEDTGRDLIGEWMEEIAFSEYRQLLE